MIRDARRPASSSAPAATPSRADLRPISLIVLRCGLMAKKKKKKKPKQTPDIRAGKAVEPLNNTLGVTSDKQPESLFSRLEGGVVRGTAGLVGGTVELVEGRAAWAKGQVVDLKDCTLDVADDVLALLRTDPEKDASFARRTTDLVLSILPVIGSTKAYADARETYQRGLESTDPKEREALFLDARRTSVMALVGLDLDIATLGTAGALARIVKVTARVYTALSLSQTVSRISQSTDYVPSLDADMKTRVADTLLKVPLIKAAIDQSLAIVPDSHRPKPEGSAP